MRRSIVVGFDGSDQSKDALALAASIGAATRARLTLARVYPLQPFYGPGAIPEPVPGWDAEQEEALLAQLRPVAAEAGAQARVLTSSSAARGLQDVAESEEAELIVVGSCHRGRIGEVFLGSVAERLLHGSPCAVMVAPAGFAEREAAAVSRIVVGYDASPEARVALAGALELARDTGAPMELVAVAEPPVPIYGKAGDGVAELKDALEEMMREQLDTALASLPGGSATARLLGGDPADELVRAASDEGDLLVLGSRGYGPVRRVLLGGVSVRVMRTARCPVLVFPRGVGTGEHAEEGETEPTANHS